VEAITLVAAVFVLVIVGAVFFFIARRILRLALKLAFAMAVVSALVITAGFGWWRGWFETGTKNRAPAAASNKRAAPPNRSPR
jgi:predicted lysophospholipase L1 biosynthesis ABC-type transport system permease subunit